MPTDQKMLDEELRQARDRKKADPRKELSGLDAAVANRFGFDPEVERLGLLPYPKGALTKGSKVDWSDWIAPQIVYEAAKAYALPGYAAQGGDYTPEEVANMAGTVSGGGIALGRAPAGALGMTIGQPKVNRLDMNYKDVGKRVPALTEAAQKVDRGELTAAQYDEIVNSQKPVTPYSFVPSPATLEDATRALDKNKRLMFGKTKEIEPGEITSLRLDIPAYQNHGVWVNSIHRNKQPTVYGSVSSVKNATMFGAPEKAFRVATGESSKGPWATITGEWNPVNEAEAVKMAQKYLNHKDWRQVGYDPERHGYFYDRTTMEPITGAQEVLQIGPLVLAKKPTYGKKSDQKYKKGGQVIHGALSTVTQSHR